MSSAPPARLLFLRPDTYGDLFLFEPVLRLVRAAWPQTEIGVLIREPYLDAAPLLADPDVDRPVRWLTTTCNPYRNDVRDSRAALETLRDTVRDFAPDCLVAACYLQTWLEPAVASFLPGTRQVRLGDEPLDPVTRAALEREFKIDWSALYPETVPVAPDLHEWEKNLRLASALLGREAARWWPAALVPAEAAGRADEILRAGGLARGAFVACCPAGIANVSIKCWPAKRYGEILAWLEREHGVRALLLGHESEREQLTTVQMRARAAGADPALWLGCNGEMPLLAALLDAARFYFGNDTGAVHLSTALSKPIVAVFGGGHWPRFRPVAKQGMVVVQPLPCFGCAWDCYFGDAPCVSTVSTATVQTALDEFLRQPAADLRDAEACDLDAGARTLIAAVAPRFRAERAESRMRLQQTRELTGLLETSERDRNARLAQIEELTAQLRDAEADREARQKQVSALDLLLKESEADRQARAKLIKTLGASLKDSEIDRDARLSQIQELTAQLHASEADRAARGQQIEQLNAWLKESESDRAARLNQIEMLTAWCRESDAAFQTQQDRIGEQEMPSVKSVVTSEPTPQTKTVTD